MTTIPLATLLDPPIERPDDLLLWADAFEDYGLADHAEAARTAHAKGLWPRRYKGAFYWDVFWDGETSLGSYVAGSRYGLPTAQLADSRRGHATIAMAFLDLVLHMVALKKTQATKEAS